MSSSAPRARAAIGRYGLGLLGAAALCAGGSARADWRELRLSTSGGAALGSTTHDLAKTAAPYGLGGGVGIDVAYGVRDALEVGAALRLALVPDLAFGRASTTGPDGKDECDGPMTASSRSAFAGATARWNIASDNRGALFVGGSVGWLRRSLGDATQVSSRTGELCRPAYGISIPDDVKQAPAVQAMVGAELRLRAHVAVGIGVEGLAAGGGGAFRALFVPVSVGYQFYPF